MKYYIAVKDKYIGEVYTISGPIDTFEKAESELDILRDYWDGDLAEDEYIGIVCHQNE